MEENEILKILETILYKAAYNPGGNRRLFYIEEQKGIYKCSNKTLTILLALLQKLGSDKEKELFWKIIGMAPTKEIAIPFLTPPNLTNKVRSLVFKNKDFVFMLFLKSGKVNEALGIIEKSTPPISKLLLALYEVLIFEPQIFDEEHLDRILSICSTVLSYMYWIQAYYQSKSKFQVELEKYEKQLCNSLSYSLAGVQPPARPTFQENMIYEIADSKDLSLCTTVAKEIKEKVYDVRLSRISSTLLEGVNLEINRDQEQLKLTLKEFNFNPDLIKAIDKIEQNLASGEDKFDFKVCIDLIRTFFNDLYASIALEIISKTGISPSEAIEGSKKMGKAIDYLHSNKVAFVSQEEHDVIVAFNSFLSYKGVHSLTSEKEYARISKNMAIEIGIFLVQRLKKYLAGNYAETTGSK